MRRYDRQLPCPLTDEEALDRGKALALARVAMRDAIDHRKAEAKRLGELCELAEAEVDRLAMIVRDRREYRPIQCEEVLRGRQVDVVRLDTGEVVQTRAATEADLQQPLFDEATVRGEHRTEQ